MRPSVCCCYYPSARLSLLLLLLQAFVQGGLSSDSPRLYYWAAALYALPWLRHGLELDTFSVSMLLLGAAHIQVGVEWVGGC